MTQEETIRVQWVGREEQTASSDVGKLVGTLKNGGTSVSTSGWTIAGDDAGDVAVYELLVEICEEVVETLVGPTTLAREKADEGVEDYKTGSEMLDDLEEAGKILWDGERTSSCGVRCWISFLDSGEDFDAGEISSKGGEDLALGGGVGVGANDDNAALDRCAAVRQGLAGGDTGGNLAGEEAMASAVVAVEQVDTGQREALVPEPAGGLIGGCGFD